MSDLQYYKMLREQIEIHPKETRDLWMKAFMDFLLKETDLEFEIVPKSKDRRFFNGCFFGGVKHINGKIYIIERYSSFDLWLLMHEFGHLASIPKEYRPHFTSKFTVKSYDKLFATEYGESRESSYAGDETFARYWSYFVAKKLGIATNIFGYYLEEPIPPDSYYETLQNRGFYSAKQLGFANVFGELNKYYF